MRDRFLRSMIAAGVAAVLGAIISVPITNTAAQTSVPMLKTPWGEPDLQGIWTDETDTPLQRPARYAAQEFFTPAQREALNKERLELLSRDTRPERGTERDVSSAYNSVFVTVKRIGERTSKIVDPPNGRIPPMTSEAQKSAATEREFWLALMQATETCKNNLYGCKGGKYDPTPSPRRMEPPPRYNVDNQSR